MFNKKRSFFEKLTGRGREEEYVEEEEEMNPRDIKKLSVQSKSGKVNSTPAWMEEETEEAELTVDVYQTPSDIVIQTMVAGVRPEDLEITIARDMVTIRGKREESRTINEENYFAKELYWGTFSRTISLPAEVEPDDAEAVEKHGLLTLKLPKIDKEKKKSVKVKSI
ncbi:MAG: Hsp20/alpha crystallin family protein [Candidatus Nomurabacteria bacterium]|nr:Hsp20/alpha crystallin family protein [Candidatus Nomurabacteria bacterium]